MSDITQMPTEKFIQDWKKFIEIMGGDLPFVVSCVIQRAEVIVQDEEDNFDVDRVERILDALYDFQWQI